MTEPADVTARSLAAAGSSTHEKARHPEVGRVGRRVGALAGALALLGCAAGCLLPAFLVGGAAISADALLCSPRGLTAMALLGVAGYVVHRAFRGRDTSCDADDC